MYEQNRKYIGVKFFHIVLLVFLLILTIYLREDKQSIEYWDKIISSIAIIMLLFQLIGFYLLKVSILDFKFWFLALTYLFMFGIVFLLAFGYEEYVFWDLHTQFPKDILFKAGFCILNYIQAFYVGAIFYQKRKYSKIYNSIVVEDAKKMQKNLFITGIILFVATLPFRLLNDIPLILSAMESKNYFKISISVGLTDDIAFLFVPAVVYIISSKVLHKKINVLFSLLISSYLGVVMILTGDRRYCVTGILAIVLCLMKTYDFKMSFISVTFGYIVSIFSLNILTVIRNIRKGYLLSLTDFFIQNSDKIFSPVYALKNTVIETMAEFGISFFSVVQIVKNIPNNIGFQYGMGFWGAIPSIMPIGWLVPEYFFKVTISSYINLIEKRPVGETIIGDLYANFGVLYIFASLILGFIISHLFSFDSTKNKNLSIARYYSLFYIEINLVRACFFEVFRNSIVIYCIPLCILYFLKKKL